MLSPLGSDWYIFILEIAWPLVVFIIGAIAMHRSGMLPQQQRLEGLLKDTISAQDEQLGMRDSTIRSLEARTTHLEQEQEKADDLYNQRLQVKDETIEALQKALTREQAENSQLRSQVADNQLKLNALIELNRNAFNLTQTSESRKNIGA